MFELCAIIGLDIDKSKYILIYIFNRTKYWINLVIWIIIRNIRNLSWEFKKIIINKLIY